MIRHDASGMEPISPTATRARFLKPNGLCQNAASMPSIGIVLNKAIELLSLLHLTLELHSLSNFPVSRGVLAAITYSIRSTGLHLFAASVPRREAGCQPWRHSENLECPPFVSQPRNRKWLAAPRIARRARLPA